MGSHLLRRFLMLSALLASSACDPVSLGGDNGSGGAGPGGATTSGGGGDAGSCGVDCSKLQTVPCTVAVCNTGQVQGPLNTCVLVPASDGTACDDGQFCTTGDVCTSGTCAGGSPNECGIAPGPCGSVTCHESSKSCDVTPVADGTTCATADPCQVDGACHAGACAGVPKDCTVGLQACQVGACDMNGTCVASPAPNGSACNDHDACTQGDACTAGACVGAPVAGCHLYFYEGFESCPAGWTLNGDWQCGAPMNVGPATAHTGNNCIATQIAGDYHDDDGFLTSTADAPPIDLTHATSPQLAFWAWVSTDSGDGCNLKISTDGGQTFQEVATVTPAYPLILAGQPAWGGDLSAAGWQPYSADLTAYAGHSPILRFAFSSDAAGVDPGVYIDDVVVAEPPQIPLYITTPSPLPDAYVGQGYSVPLAKVGGTSSSVWSIDPGGVNDAWFTIDPTLGVLSGTPSPAQVGPVTVTVRVEEPTFPSNFAEKTFTFNVDPDVYYTSWSGPCPDGWTLLGDWTCGVPMNVGPATCYVGTQCMGTAMGHDYSNNDTWAATTATSPLIDLTGVPTPILTFRMWVDTEGGTYDGANLQVSDDGGATFQVLTTVTPPYPLMIAAEPAWGGHQAALGWQLVQADLTAYSGKMILLRFAFRSDAASVYAGVYVDDFLVE